METEEIRRPIPLAVRQRQALLWAGIPAVAVAVLAVSLYSIDVPIGEIVVLCAVPLLWSCIYAYRCLTTREVMELTEYGKKVADEAAAAKAATDAEAAAKADVEDDKWYIRYPVAALCMAGAWLVVTYKDTLWWLSILLVLAGCVYAREVSLVLLVVGGIYLLFLGIAALPVSVAVIIGALVIAWAVKR